MKTNRKPHQIGLTEVTPSRMRCLAGACPALFKTTRDTYVVVGRRVTDPTLIRVLESRVAAEEELFEVPAALLDGEKTRQHERAQRHRVLSKKRNKSHA